MLGIVYAVDLTQMGIVMDIVMGSRHETNLERSEWLDVLPRSYSDAFSHAKCSTEKLLSNAVLIGGS
jgi:hypothetical protein